MILSLATIAAGLWMRVATASTSPPITLDLDGQGSLETANAVVAGKKARLEIRDAGGKLLAREEVPSPGEPNPSVALSAGALGSAGALLEAAVAGAGAECHSFWRYRGGFLSRIPVLGAAGTLADCGPPEWQSRWERPSEDAPALYTRERSRRRPNGLFRQAESFRYAGFRLEIDPALSRSSINGVEIPRWRAVVLYPRPLVEQLETGYDLSPFQSQPRVRFFADRGEGTFDLRIEEGTGSRELPVTAAAPGEGKGETILTAGSGGARVQVLVSADGSVPLQAAVNGLEGRLDQVYVPVTRRQGPALRVYDSAEQELGEELLPGTWDNGKERLAFTLLSASPLRLRLNGSEVSLSIALAPRGVDAILLPRDGSPPSLGLLLRGANTLVGVPLRCAPAAEGAKPRCEAGAPGPILHRVGALLNVR